MSRVMWGLKEIKASEQSERNDIRCPTLNWITFGHFKSQNNNLMIQLNVVSM